MKTAITTTVVLLFAVHVVAQEAKKETPAERDARRRAAIENGQQQAMAALKRNIDDTEAEIKATRRGKLTPQKRQTIARLQEQLSNLKGRLLDAKDGRAPLVPVLSGNSAPLKVGQVGTLFDPSPKVIQVIDEKNLIAEVQWYFRYQSAKDGIPYEASEMKRQLVWITGVDTTGATDGLAFKLPQCFDIATTKRYATVAGATNTVPLLEAFDPKEVAGKKP